MKLQTIVISVAVLGVAAVGLTYLDKSRSTPPPTPPRVGTPILAADLVGKTALIEISGKTSPEKIVLKKSGDTWLVDSWAGLPADVSRLTTLIGGLQENKIAAFITKNADRAAALNLGTSTLTLKDAAGTVLSVLEIGDSAKNGGTYVRLKDDPNSYASEQSLYVDTSKDSYARKQILEVEEKDVSSLALTPAGGGKTITATRAKAGDKFAGEGLAADEEISDSEVKTLLSNVLSTRFDTLLAGTDDKVTGAKDHLNTVTFKTFAGASYTLKVGRKPAPPLVLAPPPETPAAPATPEKKAEPAKTPDKPKVTATITADSTGQIINTETSVQNPDGTVTTTTTVPGQTGSTTSTKTPESAPAEPKKDAPVAVTPPVEVKPATPPAPATPPPPAEPGPVVVFYELPGSEAAWSNVFKTNTPTVPNYLLERITESATKLVTKKPPAPPAAPEPAPGTPPAPPVAPAAPAPATAK